MKRLFLGLAFAAAVLFGVQFVRQVGVLQRKNSEGNVLGRLGALRSALSVYYGDMEGQYPADLQALVPKYLPRLEPSLLGSAAAYSPHNMVDKVQVMTGAEYQAGKFTDAGGWAYVGSGDKDALGTVVVNCTHTDNRGRPWTSF